jgi:hypothetical protein
MNILYIDPYKLNEIPQMIAATHYESYTLTIWTGTENFNDYDVIAVGANEGGIFNINTILADLVVAHNNGVGVFLAHDCPQNTHDEQFDRGGLDPCLYTNESCIIAQRPNFLTNLQTLGIAAGFSTANINYVMYTDIEVLDSKHTIFNSPFDIHTISTCQETHNNGIVLSESCNILARRIGQGPIGQGPTEPIVGSTDSTNYHIALFEDNLIEDQQHGKVIYYAGGHNNYGKCSEIPSIEESQLLVNMLNYIALVKDQEVA